MKKLESMFDQLRKELMEVVDKYEFALDKAVEGANAIAGENLRLRVYGTLYVDIDHCTVRRDRYGRYSVRLNGFDSFTTCTVRDLNATFGERDWSSFFIREGRTTE